MDIRVMHYTAEGGREVTVRRDDLPTMQKMVGGYIELMRMPGDLVAIVNEEGRLHRLPRHHAVVTVAGTLQAVCGDFFVCRAGGGPDFHGLAKQHDLVLPDLVFSVEQL